MIPLLKLIIVLVLLCYTGHGFVLTGVPVQVSKSRVFRHTNIIQFHPLHESTGLQNFETDNNAVNTNSDLRAINPLMAAITKVGVLSFVASMCVALPVTLFPIGVLYKTSIISKNTKEHYSLRIGQFCSRWLMRLIPFANIRVVRADEEEEKEPVPTIWVCNHTSMLDIFLLLAVDKRLRGRNKRPIKIIYWRDLEKNPVTKLLFKMCGFIPVEMEDNGNGNKNAYNLSSFRSLLKDTKEAFNDGFDIGILPEGQLNITPEKGLQPVFPGAYTLARMSKRPIRMLGIHGLNQLWHADESIGIKVTGRKVLVRAYPTGKNFENANQFIQAFESIVGHFGANGKDLPNWKGWLDGTTWEK